MVSVLVFGASGYAGHTLMQILSRHPKVKSIEAASGARKGRHFHEYGILAEGRYSDPQKAAGVANLKKKGVIFTATPSGFASGIAAGMRGSKARLIDLSDDFRPPKPASETAVYGLSEINRERIRDAKIIANPGCYPTSVILPLAPFVAFGLIKRFGVVVNSSSGYTGAGRNPKLVEDLKGSMKPYSIINHRHIAEMEAVLGLTHLNFTPQILDIPCGLVSIISAKKIRMDVGIDLKGTILRYYEDEPFVDVLDRPPRPSDVVGTNKCLIHPVYDEHSRTVKIISALDNLIKGAAGQAVQNMNLMFGFDEGTGLQT